MRKVYGGRREGLGIFEVGGTLYTSLKPPFPRRLRSWYLLPSTGHGSSTERPPKRELKGEAYQRREEGFGGYNGLLLLEILQLVLLNSFSDFSLFLIDVAYNYFSLLLKQGYLEK